jgi:hypothetical protein
VPDPRSNLRPVPFANGNRLARRHGFYTTRFSPSEDAEIQEIVDALRDVVPLESDSLEPILQGLAGKLWRRQRAYDDLCKHGVVRHNGRTAPILRALEPLERSIRDDLDALGMTIKSAADLRLTLARTRSVDDGRFDPSRLSISERQELERLLDKAETTGAEDG